MLRIALGGNDTGRNFLGGFKEVETASDMSDRKKAGKCSRVNFLLENATERPEASEHVVICMAKELGVGVLCGN